MLPTPRVLDRIRRTGFLIAVWYSFTNIHPLDLCRGFSSYKTITPLQLDSDRPATAIVPVKLLTAHT